MKDRRLWVAIAFLVAVASCTGRNDRPGPSFTPTSAPTPTSISTPVATATPTPRLSPELALQTRCYPVPSILASDTSNWVKSNCSTIFATFVDSYTDRFGKTIVTVTIDGRMYDVRPTSLVSFQPLAVLKRGDYIILEYDGRFQNEIVSFVMMYRQDMLSDRETLSYTYDWNTDYIYLRRAR